MIDKMSDRAFKNLLASIWLATAAVYILGGAYLLLR